MNNRRLLAIVLGTILVTGFGGAMIFWLNRNCPELSQGNCQAMWGTACAAILGGVLLTETLVMRKKAQPKHQGSEQGVDAVVQTASSWYVWFRPIAWVVLASLLASLPLIMQGAIALTVAGVLTGVFLDGLVRGITNQLPPIQESNKT